MTEEEKEDKRNGLQSEQNIEDDATWYRVRTEYILELFELMTRVENVTSQIIEAQHTIARIGNAVT